MRFKLFSLFTLCILCYQVSAQSIGINNNGNSPDPNAILDLSSMDKGLLLPRTDTSAVNNGGSLPEGLIIYQNSDHSFYYYNGSKWCILEQENVFLREGDLIYNMGGKDDFLIGRTSSLPNGIFNDTLFLFDYLKGAIRNGRITSNRWQNDSIGDFSFASGENVLASGFTSIAFGSNTNARSYGSLAIGKYNVGLGNPNFWLTTDPIFEIGYGKSSSPGNAFTVLKNGSTGIRTHLPEKSLDIRGNSQIVQNSSSTNPHLLLKEDDNEYARLSFENNLSDNYFSIAGNPKVDSSSALLNIYYSDHGNILTTRGNGNVGIGTSNPSDRLHLNAVGDLNAFRVQTDGLTRFRIFDNGSISMGTNNGGVSSNDVYIHSDLGIGVSVPSERLDVAGNIKSSGIILTTGATDGYVLTSDANGSASWQASSGGEWQSNGGDVYVEPSGNVGIGTSSPNSKLEVSGRIESSALRMTSNPVSGYVLKSDANGNATWQPDNTGGGGGTDSDWFVSNPNMWSQVSGNVGVGTMNPLSKLSVNTDGLNEATVASFTDIDDGKAVYGKADTTLGNEVNYGGYFVASGRTGVGVYGENTSIIPGFNAAPRYGGLFKGNGPLGTGVRGESNHSQGVGVSAFNSGTGRALSAYSISGTAISAVSDGGLGILVTANNGTGITSSTFADNEDGVNGAALGNNSVGVRASNLGTGFGIISSISGQSSTGIWVINNGGPTSKAGIFNGEVNVYGPLSKSSGTFKIDHPSDPENKYLYHSFVESPDMMNIYNGNITTDDQGYAQIEMPDYFEDLNQEFRYQLTVMGTFSQAIVKEKIDNGRFLIQTDEGNIEVSWQVTGVRKDPYAEANRVIPVVEKEEADKGKYLHPEVYGKDKTEGIFYYNPETGGRGL